jgi:hypothetical protein
MFPPTSDGGHRVMRWTPALAGDVPRRGLIRWAGEVLGLRQAGRADLNRALRRNINSARGYERPVDMAIRRMPSQH